jgi:alanine racemase
MFFVYQGFTLSKALKVQKDAKDEGTRIAFGNLRSEVITLRNEALEKDKILLSLVKRLKTSEAKLAKLSEVDEKILKFEKEKEADAKRIADLEFVLSIQAGLHRSKVVGLENKLYEVTENLNVEQSKREIFDTEWLRVHKNVEELRQAKEECYNVAMQFSNKLKNVFVSIAAFLAEQNLIRGDLEGVVGGLPIPKVLKNVTNHMFPV